MSGCVRNIRTKNYQNLIIGFQVTAKNVGDVFLGHSVVPFLVVIFVKPKHSPPSDVMAAIS